MRACVYCGASTGTQPAFADAARVLGTSLARAGIELVYGGGRIGLMGAVADGALAAGGRVIGVIPHFLEAQEVAHTDPRVDLRLVSSMHERKALMAELADVFIALPGGFGTLEEFFEITTWVQLRLLAAPIILANLDGYYDGIVATLDHAVANGFITAANRRIVESIPTIDGVLARLAVLQGG